MPISAKWICEFKELNWEIEIYGLESFGGIL